MAGRLRKFRKTKFPFELREVEKPDHEAFVKDFIAHYGLELNVKDHQFDSNQTEDFKSN